MNGKQFLSKHYKRLATEGILKSVVIGSSVCFGINLIFAFLYWMLAFGSLWLGIGIGLGVGIISGILLYFLRYRPTEQEVARRIDRYGLEERTITMLEFKNDDSVIAELQRKDAEKNLADTEANVIKYSLSRKTVIIATVIILLSLCLTVLAGLADGGIIPYGSELLGFGDDGAYDVVYVAGEGGRIIGEDRQSVKRGDNSSAVLAFADEGWIFIGWDDGEKSPIRYDTEIKKDKTVKALFEKIDNGEGDTDDESDAADDTPFGSTSSESGGGSDGNEGGDNPTQGETGQGGGKWQDKNQFIDGATYYRDYLELYYQYALSIFGSNDDIPPEIIEFFETYFSGI